jgi:hypothetical protein
MEELQESIYSFLSKYHREDISACVAQAEADQESDTFLLYLRNFEYALRKSTLYTFFDVTQFAGASQA